VVPHPRLVERPFALIPLIEVAPGAALPDGRSLVTVLAKLAPIEDVVMIGRQVQAP
jgi:7,8-dihydro-6-hydroxymethylpterin-pyrophosphokinase